MNLLGIVRGLVRPLVTLTLTFTLAASVLRIVWTATIPPLPEAVWVGIVTAFTSILGTCAAFWFASRNQPPPTK